jgi:hypothetical protein
MKQFITTLSSLILVLLVWTSCKKSSFPVDEDGLLITERRECYVSNFEIFGPDFVTVRTKTAVIDTVAQTIAVEVQFGTDLKNLYPQFSLASDCKLDPKITGKTDFSDLGQPRVYTVVSGNREIRKPYTINLTVQPQ